MCARPLSAWLAVVAALGALLVARPATAWTPGVAAAAPRTAAAMGPGRAPGWQEAHQTGGDIVVRIERDGSARVEQAVRWHVVHGALRGFDLAAVDAAAELDPAAMVTADDGRSLTAHVARTSTGIVRVAIDDAHGLGRGTFVATVRWRLDLRASGALVRDAATWRLRLAFPPPADGIDGVRTTVDAPSSADPPEVIRPDTGAVDSGALATLRRGPERDVLELIRPHVARGEAVAWTIRLGGRAVAEGDTSAPAVVAPAPEPDRLRAVASIAALGLLAAAVSSLVARALRRPGLQGLLPLPMRWRAALSGAALAGGVALQVADAPAAGGMLVALALLAAAARAGAGTRAARKPGTWLPLRPADAFADPRGAAGGVRGGGSGAGIGAGAARRAWVAPTRVAVGAVLGGAALAGVAWFARRWWIAAPWLLPVDAAALLPLVWAAIADAPEVGRARYEARWLRRLRRRLLATTSMRVTPWARRLADGTIDERRLLVLPRAAVPGVLGIEVGLAWAESPFGPVSRPEALVRVLEGSPAYARLKETLPLSCVAVGRRADERVFRAPLAAGEGSRLAAAAAHARRLSDTLTERRSVAPNEGRTYRDGGTACAHGACAERRIASPRARRAEPARSASARAAAPREPTVALAGPGLAVPCDLGV